MDTETRKEGCHCGEGSLWTNRRVQHAVTLAVYLLGIFLVAMTLNAIKEYRFIGSNVAATNVVTVSGEGEVFARPDTGEFTFSLMEEGDTAGAVQQAVSEKADAIVSALKEKGVEEKNIKTISYELQPKYEWVQERCVVGYSCPGKNVQNGFTLTQSVRVKTSNLDTAGELIALVSEKGASYVSGLSFTIADEDASRADARKQAIDDAQAKAKKLAEDLGVTLVRIVNFSEGSGYVPMPYYAAKDMSMAIGMGGDAVEEAAVVPMGENRITSNVSISYEIR